MPDGLVDLNNSDLGAPPPPAFKPAAPRRHVMKPSKALRVADHVYRFTITDGSVDRYGDIVDPDGCVLENYERNPVVLFGHNPYGGAIGIAKAVEWVGDSWVADVEFLQDSAFAREVEAAVEAGVLNATSIGFNILAEPLKIETGYRFTLWELLEISIVCIPANRNALGSKGADAGEEKAAERPDLRVEAAWAAAGMEAAGLRAPILRHVAAHGMPAIAAKVAVPAMIVRNAIVEVDAVFAAARAAILENLEPIAAAEEPGGPAMAPAKRTGAMVALMVPPDVAAKIAQAGGEKPGDLHVILAFLGDLEVKDDTQEAVRQAVLAAAGKCPPLRGVVHGGGHFNPGPGPGTRADGAHEGRYPMIAHIDVPGLAEFRQAVWDELEARGVRPADDHGFTPHVTLAYDDDHSHVHVETTDVEFAGVVLAVGPDHEEFSLAGNPGRQLDLDRRREINEDRMSRNRYTKRDVEKAAEALSVAYAGSKDGIRWMFKIFGAADAQVPAEEKTEGIDMENAASSRIRRKMHSATLADCCARLHTCANMLATCECCRCPSCSEWDGCRCGSQCCCCAGGIDCGKCQCCVADAKCVAECCGVLAEVLERCRGMASGAGDPSETGDEEKSGAGGQTPPPAQDPNEDRRGFEIPDAWREPASAEDAEAAAEVAAFLKRVGAEEPAPA